MATPYTINFTDDSDKSPFTILPGGLNGPTAPAVRTTDLDLVGMGTAIWGEKVEENLVHILENFSSPEDAGNPGFPDPANTYAPTTPTRGQLWFNSTQQKLFIWEGTEWRMFLSTDANGDLDMEGFRILNLAQPDSPIGSNLPANPSQAATTQYVHDAFVDVSGDDISGNLSFTYDIPTAASFGTIYEGTTGESRIYVKDNAGAKELRLQIGDGTNVNEKLDIGTLITGTWTSLASVNATGINTNDITAANIVGTSIFSVNDVTAGNNLYLAQDIIFDDAVTSHNIFFDGYDSSIRSHDIAGADFSITGGIGHISDGVSTTERTEIVTVADVTDDLNGTYFLISSTTVDYYYYFNTQGGGIVDPAPGQVLGSRIDIDTNATAEEVGLAIRNSVYGHASFTAPSGEDILTVGSVALGATPDIADGVAATGFTFSTPTQGDVPAAPTNESARFKVRSNSGDILFGKYFTVSSPTVDYYWYYDDEQNPGSAIDPAPGGYTLGGIIEIRGGESTGRVQDATEDAVNDHVAFTASPWFSQTVTITSVVAGNTTDATVGDTTFTNLVITQGTSPVATISEVSQINTVADVTNSLDGSYFKIYTPTVNYFFWYSTSGGSATEPSVGSHILGGVINIATNATVDEVALATMNILYAHADFEIDSGSNLATVTIENVVGGALTTDANAGNTGFVVTTLVEGSGAAFADNDRFRTNVDGAVRLATTYEGADGGFKVQLADINAGVSGDPITYDATYNFTTDGLDMGGKPFLNVGDAGIGTVIAYAGSTAPTGWLICDGSSLNNTVALYIPLWTVIGAVFGGTGAAFNIPDLRGEFIRGYDGGRGVDAARVFGSFQADEVKSHRHLNYRLGWNENADNGGSQGNYLKHNYGTLDSPTSYFGGTDTRPRNIALNYIIKL